MHHWLQIRSELGGSLRINSIPSTTRKLQKLELPTSLKSGRSEERLCQNTYNASGRSRTDATRRASQKRRQSTWLSWDSLNRSRMRLFQLEFTSLAHLVQKLTAYEHYHPELYKDKFKRHVNMAQAEESDDSGEEQEVAMAEWTRGANPVPCKRVKQQGLVKGFDFDVTKAEQIFDLLLKEKQLK